MKILLCEDDNNIATIASLALEKVGNHQVIRATDGEQSLNLGMAENFDLILLDDMMPKMSGVDVCAKYVESGKKIAPVIFMSANPQESRVEQFSSVAIGYIPKPFDPMTLNQQIENIMNGLHKKAI